MKIYKNDFDKVYENLSTMNEAAGDPNAHIWRKAQDGLIDVEAFHNAFDKDLDEETKAKLFDPTTGLLLNRGTWGIIKEMDKNLPLTKNLKKFWQAQFSSASNYRVKGKIIHDIKDYEAALAKEEEERREREIAWEKKRAYRERCRAMSDEIISLVDKDLYTKVVNEWHFQELDSEWTIEDLKMTDRKAYDYDTIYIQFGSDEYYLVNGDKSAEENAKALNNQLATIYDKLSMDIDVREAKWWSLELMKNCDDFVLVFQLPDGSIKSLRYPSKQKLLSENLPMDAELVGTKRSTSSTATYTFQDSSYEAWYSVSDNINDIAAKELRVNLHPETFEDDSVWGKKTYTELTKEEASKNYKYFITGMSRWFNYTNVSYGTD